MHSTLLRYAAALMTGLGLVAGLLGVAAVPAQAAGFRVSISASATHVHVGGTVTLTGKVLPKPAKRYVNVQRRFVGSNTWRTVKKVRTTRSGSYRVKLTMGNDKDRYYRILTPKQHKRKAGHSAAVQVIVDPVSATQASLQGITPTSGALSGGTTLTLAGTGLAGTGRVTFTPQVAKSDTRDGSGVLPELSGTVTVVDDSTLTVRTPASLGGPSLVKIYTPSGTLTATYTFVMTTRSLSSFEQDVLDQINARRAVAQTCTTGSTTTTMPAVAPVAGDGKLADLALSHSRDLATRQAVYKGITHTTYGTSSWTTRFTRAGFSGRYGEILEVSGAASSAAAVVDGWMRSRDGHCNSLMSSGWTKAGVGVASGAWNNGTNNQDSIFSNVDFQ